MNRLLLCSLSLCLSTGTVAFAQTSAPGYDVIMLAGQSNMVGYNTTADNPGDAATSPQVFMWSFSNGTIVAAQDPLIMSSGSGSSSYNIGPGLTFAKAYAASLPSNRKVLLVGVAVGGTGFNTNNGGWLPAASGSTCSNLNGSLALNAVCTTNAAIAAAGTGARFAGIVWDQGETDVVDELAASYQTNITNLISYFRSNVTGATSTTPFICTEFTYAWMTDNLNGTLKDANGNSDAAAQYTIQTIFHQLPDQVNNTAWTASALLPSDPNPTAANNYVGWGDIHFNVMSQRQMGRRDADRFFEAQQGLPQTETQMVSYNGYFWDIGRSYPNGVYPVNFGPSTSGTVTQTVDTARGTVAQISQGNGYLTYSIPATTFNGSYTKYVWFKPGASGYYNNLIDGINGSQSHYLLALNTGTGLYLAANHVGGSTSPTITAQVTDSSSAWVNIALTYDASAKVMTLYYNGAVVATVSGVAPAAQLSGNPVNLNMGSYGSNSNGSTAIAGLDGEMAGNRVWNSALTAAQINAIYTHELSYRAGW